MNDLPRMILDTITEHIPQSAAWLPYAGMSALALFGLIVVLKGAKLAPAMAAFTFLGIGGVAGSFVAHWLTLPVWPTIGAAAVIGFVAGLTLFKIWLTILVAGCFIAASLTLYLARVASPYVQNYASQGYNPQDGAIGVTIPDPGSILAAAPTAHAELGQLWKYLSSQIPNFQTSFWAIVASTGLAGITVGLFLPRTSRAVLAASLGTFCVVGAIAELLRNLWPAAMNWLSSLGAWGWCLVGFLWGVALLHNLLDIRPKRGKKPAAAAPSRAQTAKA